MDFWGFFITNTFWKQGCVEQSFWFGKPKAMS